MGQISTADYGQLKQGQIVHCLNKDRGRAGKSLVISHPKPCSLLQTPLNWRFFRKRLSSYNLKYVDQSVTNIFEYSNILVTNIYSDIRSCQFFFYEYIRTFVRVKFVCTNIFGHSLVIVLECKTKTNIRIYSNIRTIFNTNTYSNIRSCQQINMNIFGYSFV